MHIANRYSENAFLGPDKSDSCRAWAAVSQADSLPGHESYANEIAWTRLLDGDSRCMSLGQWSPKKAFFHLYLLAISIYW